MSSKQWIISGQGGIRTHTPFRTDASKAPLSRQFQHLAIFKMQCSEELPQLFVGFEPTNLSFFQWKNIIHLVLLYVS